MNIMWIAFWYAIAGLCVMYIVYHFNRDQMNNHPGDGLGLLFVGVFWPIILLVLLWGVILKTIQKVRDK